MEKLKVWDLFFFALKNKSDMNDIERGGYVHVIEMCYSRRGCVKKNSAKTCWLVCCAWIF